MSTTRRADSLFLLELRALLASRAPTALLLVAFPLVGVSFRQALDLFAEASRSARDAPGLAAALDPMAGVVVPTFGAEYLVLTLLYPFLAIRIVAESRETGAMDLLLQLPRSRIRLVLIRVGILALALVLAELPGLLALGLWRARGGHLHAPEIATLLAGHLFYGLLVGAIGFAAAASTNSGATAALVTLAVTLGSWALDFAASSGGAVASRLGALSLTSLIRPFERGLFVPGPACGALLLSGALFALTAVCWDPGRPLRSRLATTAALLPCCAIGVWLLAQPLPSWDATEDRRHSFSPALTDALRGLGDPLQVTAYFSRQDPRWVDLDRGILARIRRTVRRVSLDVREPESAGRFDAPDDERYGLVVYRIGDRSAESRSTSEEEVLPLVFDLARVPMPHEPERPPYPGYPSTRGSAGAAFPFFVLGPAFALSLLVFAERRA